MNLIPVLSSLLVIIITPFVAASTTSDTGQADKTEKEKVAQPLKKEKTTFVKTFQKKKEQIEKKVKEEKTKFKEARKVSSQTPHIKQLNSITVIQGKEFMVTRPASPNFGRTWKLNKKLPPQVAMIGNAQFIPARHPGRNEGTIVFTFKALKPGVTQIELEKVYPPELRDKKPLKIGIVPVEIRKAQ